MSAKTVTSPPANPVASSAVPIRRIELDNLVKQLRDLLGEEKWAQYYSCLCRFLLGKLSRDEYHQYIAKRFLQEDTKDHSFKPKFIKFHNKFLLASLANSFRESPNSAVISSDGFGYLNTLSGKNQKRQKLSSDVTEHEKLKKTIMSLTIKERRRIKNISANHDPRISFLHKKQSLGSVAQDRLALLPKIPAGIVRHSNSNSASSTPGGLNPTNQAKIATQNGSQIAGNKEIADPAKKTKPKNVNSLEIKVEKEDKNLNLMQRNGGISTESANSKSPASNTPTSAGSHASLPANSNSTQQNLGIWTQEIMNGISTVLSSESYELPDTAMLKNRMLGIMREHGLIGGVSDQCLNIMIVGLENYLKNIVEAAIDTVRYRKFRYDENSVSEDIELSKNEPRREHKEMNLDSTSSSTSSTSSPNSSTSVSTSMTSSSSINNEVHRKRKISLTAEDLYDTFKLAPHLLEVNGIMDKISSAILRDDDEYKIDSLNTSGVIDTLPISDEMPAIGSTNSKTHKKTLETLSIIHQYSGIPIAARKEVPEPAAVASNGIEASMEGANETVEKNEGTRDELKWLIHDLLS